MAAQSAIRIPQWAVPRPLTEAVRRTVGFSPGRGTLRCSQGRKPLEPERPVPPSCLLFKPRQGRLNRASVKDVARVVLDIGTVSPEIRWGG